MSLRSSTLAVLTLGPAYGLQLHHEIEARTSRVGCINVGQTYSTLSRLTIAGCVAPAGVTDDALPLYRLTDAGRAEAEAWLAGHTVEAEWSAMVAHVLLAASLPGVPDGLRELIRAYRAAWTSLGQGGALAPSAAYANDLLASAARRWLDDVEARCATGELVARGYDDNRPRRGRRPR
ncbi:PadR family transcriptional regulator [Subtercola sp. RTI3]|uniref:PadR family transcriptional regulator n=1 Tax=Subtercola sp. RTI3 TaxID=3048639 RepID=UPI002B2382AC|nr:helix-turn-helix transcriptional regulator [Subtercola sp. RTI3]MEA9984953.1 helix-turn-helix transcriptional regulator [Subtercola sp. RTI3]